MHNKGVWKAAGHSLLLPLSDFRLVVSAAESCVTKGQVLNKGACAGFTSYFRNNPNCAADATTFRAAVVAGPPPSAACVHVLNPRPAGPPCTASLPAWQPARELGPAASDGQLISCACPKVFSGPGCLTKLCCTGPGAARMLRTLSRAAVPVTRPLLSSRIQGRLLAVSQPSLPSLHVQPLIGKAGSLAHSQLYPLTACEKGSN